LNNLNAHSAPVVGPIPTISSTREILPSLKSDANRSTFSDSRHGSGAFASIARKNLLTGRFEWSQRDELFADQPALESTLPHWFDISAYTAGYTREVGSWHDANLGIGANATAYGMGTPARTVLTSIYGDRLWGASVFVRVRMTSSSNPSLYR